jgi:hypothetical protein
MRRWFAFAFVASCATFILAIAPAAARVDIRIDLSSQSMVVQAPGQAVQRWAISSGRRGFRTPTGAYSAKRLARMHYSSKYDDAPMPHSIFFSGGYAIHGTSAVRALGRPASHGCIRLAPGNAARLFSLVQAHGARIAIAGVAPDESARAARRQPKRLAPVFVDEDAPVARVGRFSDLYGRAWPIDPPMRGGWRLR